MRKLIPVVLVIVLALIGSQLMAQPQTTDPAGSTRRIKNILDFADIFDDPSASDGQIQAKRWKLILSGYSDSAKGRNLSSFRAVDADFSKDENANGKGLSPKTMGMRVHFAKGYNNDWAKMTTRIPLLFFKMDDEKGFLSNVGPVKKVSVWTRGLNYRHALEVRLVDYAGKIRVFNFGGLGFRGWRKLTWDNPDFVEDSAERDVKKTHLYPYEKPYLMIDSIVIYKSSAEYGGDFVTYLKNIELEYEPFYAVDELVDIDHEGSWGIQQEWKDEAIRKIKKKLFYQFSGSTIEDEVMEIINDLEADSGQPARSTPTPSPSPTPGQP